MKKNLDNITLESVNLTDEDLIAINSNKHICLLRENQVYQIKADLKSIMKNSENVEVEYMHKLCLDCENDKDKKFIPLKTLREVYDIMHKDCKKTNNY